MYHMNIIIFLVLVESKAQREAMVGRILQREVVEIGVEEEDVVEKDKYF